MADSPSQSNTPLSFQIELIRCLQLHVDMHLEVSSTGSANLVSSTDLEAVTGHAWLVTM